MRAALVFVSMALLCGCLSPGDPLYGPVDRTQPKIVSVRPDLSGGMAVLQATQLIEVTFSEPLDITSLRPGIAVRNSKREEQQLDIRATASNTVADKDFEWKVQISSAEGGFLPGAHVLVIHPFIVDQQGNSLLTGEPRPDGGAQDDFLAAFTVQ